MSKCNVVVINPDGIIIAVEEYNPANRPQSVFEAARRIGMRLDIPTPEFKNSTTDALGNEWGKMTGDFEPGMVEIGIGKWGFEK